MQILTEEQNGYIVEAGRTRAESLIQAQSQVLNWLFAFHGGGLAGVLAYAASREATCSVKIATGGFSFGLLALVAYAAMMYYFESAALRSFIGNARSVRSGEITWDEYARREYARPIKYVSCEVVAWLSALGGIAGMAATIAAIL